MKKWAILLVFLAGCAKDSPEFTPQDRAELAEVGVCLWDQSTAMNDPGTSAETVARAVATFCHRSHYTLDRKDLYDLALGMVLQNRAKK